MGCSLGWRARWARSCPPSLSGPLRACAAARFDWASSALHLCPSWTLPIMLSRHMQHSGELYLGAPAQA